MVTIRQILLTLGSIITTVTATAQNTWMSGQQTIALEGRWSFAIDRTHDGVLPHKFIDTIILPGSMLTNDKGDETSANTQWICSIYDSSYYHNPAMERYRMTGRLKVPFFLTPRRHYVGNAWYRKSVTIPREWRNRQVTLFLERPHIETTIYVNGKKAGHQTSLSVPHQYDITPWVRFGKKNDITIQVYNGIENVCVGPDSHSVTDQTQGDWNGIAGKIALIASPPVNRLNVIPHISTASADILINDTIIHISLPQPLRLWSERDPYLYTVPVAYNGDTIPVTFGMREIKAGNDRNIYLNGQVLKLRGTVGNCCFPETGYPPTDVESWLRIFRKCKEYGLNHMRFHSYCPPDAAFTAADQVGFYLQPEGPSWPNHGIKLRKGMPIDTYLTEECKRIIYRYGHHPSLLMLAAGNEPAGDWVRWGQEFVQEMHTYDSSRIYSTASVGGGWAWDIGSEYHVKGGARGLEWDDKAPQSTDDFADKMIYPRNFKPTEQQPVNIQPCISHEVGQWCAFPDFKEIPLFTGVYQPGNLEIFRDLLADNGMSDMAEKFLHASGKLQTLAYKYDIERNLRTKDYAGFQLLSLNDYSGQGTALVGTLNVHWREKGYCTPKEWREFCSERVPLARLPRFVYTDLDTLHIGTALYDTTQEPITILTYEIMTGKDTLTAGTCHVGDTINFVPGKLRNPIQATLIIHAGTSSNHYDMWIYPSQLTMPDTSDIYICDTLDSKALSVLEQGGKVLITAAGKIRYGNDVVHTFLPVFWNTSWFKMRPPHTTGLYIQNTHPVFCDFPTDDWQNLNWWELTNKTQVMNLSGFPKDYQPVVQPIDTWHISRKLGMLIEAKILKGKLLMTTIDISNDLTHRAVARQLRYSILRYMSSATFQPTLELQPERVRELFEQEAPKVNMFTNSSPDELKPKLY